MESLLTAVPRVLPWGTKPRSDRGPFVVRKYKKTELVPTNLIRESTVFCHYPKPAIWTLRRRVKQTPLDSRNAVAILAHEAGTVAFNLQDYDVVLAVESSLLRNYRALGITLQDPRRVAVVPRRGEGQVDEGLPLIS